MFRKPKHEIPSMDEVDCNKIYAFSYNPIDKFQHFEQNEHYRLQMFKTDMDKIFKAIDVVLEYYIELSAKGRCHLHGYLQFLDIQIARFYLVSVKKLVENGTLVIKVIEDPVVWHNYVIKQQKLLLPSYKINRINIPITFNIYKEETLLSNILLTDTK